MILEIEICWFCSQGESKLTVRYIYKNNEKCGFHIQNTLLFLSNSYRKKQANLQKLAGSLTGTLT